MEAKQLKATRTQFPPCALRTTNGCVLVGTYELDKASGMRHGSIEVYDMGLNMQGSYETYGAVLDLKISEADSKLVGSAHSTGNIMLWRHAGMELELVANIQVFAVDVLVTSLNFAPHQRGVVVVTATSGEVRLVDIESGAGSRLGFEDLRWEPRGAAGRNYTVQGVVQSAVNFASGAGTCAESHELECWTAEFGVLSPLENVVFSGGDDCKVIAHDFRQRNCIWSNAKVHNGGVVAIKSSTHTFRSSAPTSLLTGSYDDHIRSFDLRMMGQTLYPGARPLNVSEMNLGGGVWRFVESPRNALSPDTNELLVCCMYNGAKILSFGTESMDIVSKRLEGHESMCYGGDWSSECVTTCSFYDKSLQMWLP